jgi:hypothetical protein
MSDFAFARENLEQAADYSLLAPRMWITVRADDVREVLRALRRLEEGAPVMPVMETCICNGKRRKR